ncbi:MAG: hypothetical protein LC808_06455 [Actinobacteria bacterium]|nr:hypothetical protein [Actinomycetota bacterium]
MGSPEARQFGEVLTARAFIQFGLPNMPQKQYQRFNGTQRPEFRDQARARLVRRRPKDRQPGDARGIRRPLRYTMMI